MEILALQDIRVMLGIQSAQCRNVDIETRVKVDPSCINNIVSLAVSPLSGPWVDIQQVLASDSATWGSLLDDGLVVVVGKVE